MKKAFLLLSDGKIFEGRSRGASGLTLGEAVFHTDGGSYMDVLTSTVFLGRIVCMTNPLIGNCGVYTEDCDTDRPWLSGFVVRNLCDIPSNWQSMGPLASYLAENGVVCVSDVDTRAITRHIRDNGSMSAAVFTEDCGAGIEEIKDMLKKYAPPNPIGTVSSRRPGIHGASGEKRLKIALYDFGDSRTLVRFLAGAGCSVTVLPPGTTAETIPGAYDGVILSHGPGYAEEGSGYVGAVKELLGCGVKLLGIGLGCQLIAAAAGIGIKKLPFGHYGGNQPVRDVRKGVTYITYQNYSWGVGEDGFEGGAAEITHRNVNDGAVEGIVLRGSGASGVLFTPDTDADFSNTGYIFEEFLKDCENGRSL